MIRSSAVLRAAAFALVALLSACGGREKPANAAAPATAEASPPVDVNAPPAPDATPVAKATVTIYFPSASGDELIGETREIADTKRPDDRGAQIIAALLAGPTTDAALPAVPPGTTLRRLWVRDDGNAYADFSDELAAGTTGGSDDEILTVYAIVDSLTSNVPAIRRVAILVAGRERETFGHLDLRRPLPPDLSLTLATKPTE